MITGKAKIRYEVLYYFAPKGQLARQELYSCSSSIAFWYSV
jgi:hypothetical protein